MQVREIAVGVDTADFGKPMSRGITSFGAWMLGVGSIIGSMAWLIHGYMLARGGALASMIAWVLAGLMTLPLVAILSELSSMFPTAGGPYVYKFIALKRLLPAHGELVGFLAGWLYWIAMITGIACMANGLSDLISAAMFGGSQSAPHWFGPSVILTLFIGITWVNQITIKNASKVINAFSMMKIAMAVLFCWLVFSQPSAVPNFAAAISSESLTTFPSHLSAVLMLAVVGLSGMEVVGCTASETVDARRNVPRAILFTLCTVVLIYFGVAAAMSAASPYVLSTDASTVVIPHTDIQATCPQIAGFLGGPIAGALMTLAVILSVVASTFNALLAMARVGYSMAESGLFPAPLAVLHNETGVPANALWFQCWFLTAISLLGLIASKSELCPNAFAFLGEVFGFLYGFLAVFYAVALISLRYTDPNLPRPFRIGKSGNELAWTVAAAAVVLYSYVALACTTALQQLVGVALLALGIPIYLYFRRDKKGAKHAIAE
jgi:amino acid transporter